MIPTTSWSWWPTIRNRRRFFTFISTTDQTIVSQLPFPDATNGIEQPAYSPTTGRFYVAIPQTEANPGGEIAVLSPGRKTFEGAFPLPVNCITHLVSPGAHPYALWAERIIDSSAADGHAAHLRHHRYPGWRHRGHYYQRWRLGRGLVQSGDNRYYLAASGWTSTGVTGGPAFLSWASSMRLLTRGSKCADA